MKQNEAVTGARGQIIWILALVLSTATVIHLERLDISAAVVAALPSVDGALTAAAAEALAAAEARHKASPKNAETVVALVLALAVAVQAGALDLDEGRTRVEALGGLAAGGTQDARAVAALAELTFGR